MTSRRKQPRLLPYPPNIKKKDIKITQRVLGRMLDPDEDHCNLGEMLTIYPTIPDRSGAWSRHRCAKCDKMIEKDEVLFCIYEKWKNHWTRWSRSKYYHLVCFIRYLDDFMETLEEEMRKTIAYSDGLKKMLNEGKLWYRTVPKAEEPE